MPPKEPPEKWPQVRSEGRHNFIPFPEANHSRLTLVEDPENKPKLRFAVGDIVYSNIGGTWWSNQFDPDYRIGRVMQIWYHQDGWPANRFAPYHIMLLHDHELKVGKTPITPFIDDPNKFKKEFPKAKAFIDRGGGSIFAPVDEDMCVKGCVRNRVFPVNETSGYTSFKAKEKVRRK